MKKLFYAGLIALMLFEILNVYFIMPMPGSQQMNSLPLAYFLYTFRWNFRICFIVMIAAGSKQAFQGKRKWIAALACLPPLVVVYVFNFKMTADKMFLQPATLTFGDRAHHALSDSTLVIAVAHDGEAKAYPVRFIIYHHQVRDTLAGVPIMVTYCSVCRTGRVYNPVVNGKNENFRLVGMDHFNAMFEDVTTKSWWRQVNGEAVAGSLTGQTLPEVESSQLTIGKFSLYPFGKVMEKEEAAEENYDLRGRYEQGRSKGSLTRTDSVSWKDKSWVVGVVVNNSSKAYDWNQLKEQHIINDRVGGHPIVLILSDDDQSFAAFERPSDHSFVKLQNDTLLVDERPYDLSGRSLDASANKLKTISAYQEFWHSWRTFHPNTTQYR